MGFSKLGDGYYNTVSLRNLPSGEIELRIMPPALNLAIGGTGVYNINPSSPYIGQPVVDENTGEFLGNEIKKFDGAEFNVLFKDPKEVEAFRVLYRGMKINKFTLYEWRKALLILTRQILKRYETIFAKNENHQEEILGVLSELENSGNFEFFKIDNYEDVEPADRLKAITYSILYAMFRPIFTQYDLEYLSFDMDCEDILKYLDFTGIEYEKEFANNLIKYLHMVYVEGNYEIKMDKFLNNFPMTGAILNEKLLMLFKCAAVKVNNHYNGIELSRSHLPEVSNYITKIEEFKALVSELSKKTDETDKEHELRVSKFHNLVKSEKARIRATLLDKGLVSSFSICAVLIDELISNKSEYDNKNIKIVKMDYNSYVGSPSVQGSLNFIFYNMQQSYRLPYLTSKGVGIAELPYINTANHYSSSKAKFNFMFPLLTTSEEVVPTLGAIMNLGQMLRKTGWYSDETGPSRFLQYNQKTIQMMLSISDTIIKSKIFTVIYPGYDSSPSGFGNTLMNSFAKLSSNRDHSSEKYFFNLKYYIDYVYWTSALLQKISLNQLIRNFKVEQLQPRKLNFRGFASEDYVSSPISILNYTEGPVNLKMNIQRLQGSLDPRIEYIRRTKQSIVNGYKKAFPNQEFKLNDWVELLEIDVSINLLNTYLRELEVNLDEVMNGRSVNMDRESVNSSIDAITGINLNWGD